jgi:hypothetical protein
LGLADGIHGFTHRRRLGLGAAAAGPPLLVVEVTERAGSPGARGSGCDGAGIADTPSGSRRCGKCCWQISVLISTISFSNMPKPRPCTSIKRIALTVAAQADRGAQVIHLVEVFLPELVDGAENGVSVRGI